MCKFTMQDYAIIGFCYMKGIQQDEKFKIKLKDGSASAEYYRLNICGLQIYSELTDNWYYIKDGVEKILSDDVEIIKAPLFPRFGDEYYLVVRVDESSSEKGVVKRIWKNSKFDFDNYVYGNCFETKEKAEEIKDNLSDIFEMTMGF